MSLLDSVLRPVMRAWVAAAVDDIVAAVPRPADAPHAHADGAGAARTRVLVIGPGIASGWGVLSHDLALPGSLARALAVRLGHGVDVDLIVDPAMLARHASARMPTLPLWRYGAIVLTLGINDAVDLTSPPRWERDLRTATAAIRAEAGTEPVIVLAGIQAVRSVAPFDSLLGVIADRRAAQLNRVTERVARDQPGVVFAPLSPAMQTTTDRYREPESYRRWAAEIAEPLAPCLADVRPVAEGFRDEARRQAAVDALHLSTASTEPFDRLVALARRVFATEAAAFSVIDGDTHWFKSQAGFAAEGLPRSEGFCSAAIETTDGLVLADAREDARFRDLDLVTQGVVRFYAGYPVVAPDGEPIGALCVFDSHPRDTHDVDLAVLRHLAQLISDELEQPVGARR